MLSRAGEYPNAGAAFSRAAKPESVSPARAAFYTRMIETWKLLAPSAPLKANLPEDKRSPVLFRAGEEQRS